MSFHVFLSHSSADKPAVEELARRLAKEGIQAWLDKWHLIPGDPWQPAIEGALAESETCAVFVGPSGLGPWQNEEMRAAIDRRVRDSKRSFRIIPVLLPGAERAERSSLPTFLVATTWVEFRSSLDEEEVLHRLVCGIRGIEPGVGPGQAIYEGQCPYRGLRVFDVDDAPFFFGREALVQWLLNKLRPASDGQQVNRFLAIVGSSGSGKSSVARAGLVAAIKRGEIQNSSCWPVTVCRPGPDPIESLAVALSRIVNNGQWASALADLIAEFKRNEKTLHLTVRRSLPENSSDMRLVLLLDQFEEVFTLCTKDELRDAFVANLLYAAKVAQGQTLVILTMRADFYGKCAANAELAAALSDHNFLVGPMTDDELRRAIERPAQLVGCELDAGLVDLLVQDVRNQPGALPLLQHALLELWNKREGRRLTVKAYQEIGKLEGALQRRADATLKAFSEDERELCRRTFLRLTQPGEGTEDTKRRASMQELLSLSGKSTAEEEIIQKLANASLLTTEGDLSHKDAFVEVAHEALIRNWSQLRKWIDLDRAGLRTRTRLTEAVRDWKNAGRDAAFLYTGARLAVANEWAASHPHDLSTEEAEFLACSREAQLNREESELAAAQRLARAEAERAEEAEKRAKEQKRASYKLRRLAIAAGGAAVAALILLALSVVEMYRETNARNNAEYLAKAANDARDQADGLINFMLIDLRDKLQPIGRLNILDDVAKKAKEYLERLPEDLLSTQRLQEREVMLRNLGDVLVLQGRLQEAMDVYQQGLATAKRLTEQDKSNANWQRELVASYERVGNALVVQGKLPEALDAYEHGLNSQRTLAEQNMSNAGWQRDLSASYDNVGGVLEAQGKLPEALVAYQQSLNIQRILAEQDKSNAGWQRNLSVSYEKVGGVLEAQGELPEALHAYQQSLNIRQTLAAQDKSNTGWQRDLSVGYEKVGDVMKAQGKLLEASDVYQQELAIAKRLAVQDKSNADWQRDLSVSYEKVGGVAEAQGKLPEALDAYLQSLNIRQTLAAQDKLNADWQRDLSVSYEKVGGVAEAQGKLSEALDVYQQSLNIRRTLADQDKSNVRWQRDLSVSYEKIGDVLKAQGRLQEATNVYQQELAITKRLAKQDESNFDWQRNLSVSYEKVGDVLNAQGKLPEALDVYQQSLNIRRTLADHDKSNVGWQRDLSVSYEKVGDVLETQGKLREALDAYLQELTFAKRLAEQDKSNASWQRDLIVSCYRTGTCMAKIESEDNSDQANKFLRTGLQLAESYAGADRQSLINAFNEALDIPNQ
jgi:tetratricopeptide (TPR) repeat protein